MNSMSGEKLKGIPYTGTLPAVLTGTKAGYLHRYKVYGNTEQTGTPTPENPIVPSECGERTQNRFDKNATDTTNGYIDGKYIRQSDGAMISDNGYAISEYMEVTENTTYRWTFSLTSTSKHSAPTVEYLDETKTRLSVATHSSTITQFNFTTPANCKYVRASVYKPSISEAMLNEGSTAPTSYIPYGYKLPLTSAGQSVDIYLGESQATRRIKKLVLTGEETMYASGGDQNRTVAQIQVNEYFKGAVIGYCNILKWKSSYATTDYNRIVLGNYPSTEPTRLFYLSLVNSLLPEASLNGIKSYLAQQYANGTPVTVWYVLATEETGTVNEPLRKIGNYADTIDSTQTTTQIPTTAGSTTISWAGSGLAPSEFDSIQEWVDIPTYTYTNGEWVDDNSN